MRFLLYLGWTGYILFDWNLSIHHVFISSDFCDIAGKVSDIICIVRTSGKPIQFNWFHSKAVTMNQMKNQK